MILGYTDLLVIGLPEGSPQRVQANEVRKAGERASNLTRQLLAFSRKQVLELRPVNVSTLVADMEKMIRRLVGEDVRVQTRLASDPGWIRADPGQVEQVLMNLVVNARDAMPRGGNLGIRTERRVLAENEEDGVGGTLRPGPFGVLEVSDSGVGMGAETLRRIFEPFFTTKTVGKGTGLGLATVQSVVIQGGGQISLRTREGEGTTFRVYFPLVEAPVESPATPPAERARAPQAGTVLLVEDDPAIRGLVAETLAGAGFRVEAAGSAEAAFAFLLEHPQEPLALLLTDLVLPGANGLDLARRFRRSHPGTPILGMTGYVDRTEFEGSLGTVINGLLQKPFRPGTVLKKVAELVGGGGTGPASSP